MWRAHLKPGFRRLTSQFSVGPRSPEARGSARAFAGRASRTGREAAKPPVEAQAKEPTEVKEPPKEEPKAQVTDLPDGLIVLPLLRKPAFPSFKQILQVSEPEVIDLLKTYRSKNQFEYIGGFLMKDAAGQDPPRAFGSSEPSGLRRDAGKAESVNQLEEVGTLLQVLEIISFSNNAGGQITVMPKYRVRKTGTLTQSTPYVPLPVVRYRALEPIQAIENVEEAKSALAPLATVRALALALVLWGLGSARLTKPKGVELDDQELTALAQLSEKAGDAPQAERVKDEETSQEDASDEDNIDKLKEEPLNRSKSEEEKELKEQENEQGKVKIVRDEATPKQITRVDVKVHHANQPLPEDEKVDAWALRIREIPREGGR
ncbi:unnamed protein product [Durusdinium trenchii]|uniref:Lon N-terminal domain-containing protein n=1 Tax=Durusdinium trenchii TaxID=1381693 RepID=A0ABP0S980_9DINO